MPNQLIRIGIGALLAGLQKVFTGPWCWRPSTDLAAARALAERLRAAAAEAVVHSGTQAFQVTVTIGAVTASKGEPPRTWYGGLTMPSTWASGTAETGSKSGRERPDPVLPHRLRGSLRPGG